MHEGGWLQLDLADGDALELPGMAAQPDPLVPAGERMANVGAGHQFRAADAAHIQASSARAHPQWGSQWQWQLHAIDGGTQVGQVALPVACAPFQVVDTRLLVQLPAQAWRSGDSRFEVRKLRLTAHDLASGLARWSVDLADPDFKGAMPP